MFTAQAGSEEITDRKYLESNLAYVNWLICVIIVIVIILMINVTTMHAKLANDYV